jgi:hypothetical protein
MTRFHIFVALYLFAVVATCTLGAMFNDEHGVGMSVAVLLTLPWCYVVGRLGVWAHFDALFTLYDIPLICLSALLNVVVASLAHRYYLRNISTPFPHVAPGHDK